MNGLAIYFMTFGGAMFGAGLVAGVMQVWIPGLIVGWLGMWLYKN